MTKVFSVMDEWNNELVGIFTDLSMAVEQAKATADEIIQLQGHAPYVYRWIDREERNLEPDEVLGIEEFTNEPRVWKITYYNPRTERDDYDVTIHQGNLTIGDDQLYDLMHQVERQAYRRNVS